MADRTRGYAHRIDVSADGTRVWRALTDDALLARWCAIGTTMRAREGGNLRARFVDSAELDAFIDVFIPGRRIRLVHMPVAGLPNDGVVIVDDFLLEAGPTETIVRLLGSGFPDDKAWEPHFLQLRRDWERALARLKVLLDKRMDLEAT
jgi:hypothetical protein